MHIIINPYFSSLFFFLTHDTYTSPSSFFSFSSLLIANPPLKTLSLTNTHPLRESPLTVRPPPSRDWYPKASTSMARSRTKEVKSQSDWLGRELRRPFVDCSLTIHLTTADSLSALTTTLPRSTRPPLRAQADPSHLPPLISNYQDEPNSLR
jgi:hypothetical protein